MTANLVPIPDSEQPNAMQHFTGLTREDVEVLKQTICKDATDAELKLFEKVCNYRRLNPFTGQIHFVKRRQWNARLNGGDGGYEEVASHQTGIDGYRLIAERTGRYGGPVGTWWCGKDGKWRDVWLEDEPPAAAKVAIQRTDFAQPSEAIARWKAYVQTRKGGGPNAMWARMDAEQLAKCAEALVLRKVFPEELSGIYTTDEMAQADNPPMEATQIIGELEADGEHGAIQVDRSGLPLPEIIAAIRQPEQAHHLLKDPDLSEDYRQAVRRTVEGDGLNWSSFWRTASPLAWRTILDRALTEFQASGPGAPPAPPATPPGSDPTSPSSTDRHALAGETSQAATDSQAGTPKSPEPNPSPTAAAGSGEPTSRRSPPSPGGRRGSQSRSEVSGGASAGTNSGETTASGEGPPTGPQRTSERRAATDATSSVKQAGSVDPTEGNREGTDPSLLPELPGWES